MVNLSLHARWLDVQEQDREFAHAEREHEAALGELRQLYLVQLDHALQATYTVAPGQEGRPRLRERALTGAVEMVRLLDHQHLQRVREVQLAFFDAWRPQERDSVAGHRDEVRRLLTTADAVVFPSGHVGLLARLLHLFHVEPSLPRTVVAWSAGAMALTERIVLFHDHVPHGVAQTEVLGEGIGLVPGLVLLPHARRRLRVDDPVRMECWPAGSPRHSASSSTTAFGCPWARTGRSRPARGWWPTTVASRSSQHEIHPTKPLPALAALTPLTLPRGPRTKLLPMNVSPSGSRKLAINRLRDRTPLDSQTVDRFLARHEVPIVEGSGARSSSVVRPTRYASSSGSSVCPSTSRCAASETPTCGTSCSSCPRGRGSTTSSRCAAATTPSRSTTR